MNINEFKDMMREFDTTNIAGIAIPHVGLGFRDSKPKTTIAIDGNMFRDEKQLVGCIALADALDIDLTMPDGRVPMAITLTGEYGRNDIEELEGRFARLLEEYDKFKEDFGLEEETAEKIDGELLYNKYDMSLMDYMFNDNVTNKDLLCSLNDIYQNKEIDGFKVLRDNVNMIMEAIINDYDEGQDDLEYYQECIAESIKRSERARFDLRRRVKKAIDEYLTKKSDLLLNNIEVDPDIDMTKRKEVVISEITKTCLALLNEAYGLIDKQVDEIIDGFRQRMVTMEILLDPMFEEDGK